MGISVSSPYYFRLIPATGKSRLTRSGARHRRPGPVVDLRLFLRRAARSCSRITAATVFSLSRHPRLTQVSDDPRGSVGAPVSSKQPTDLSGQQRRRAPRRPRRQLAGLMLVKFKIGSA